MFSGFFNQFFINRKIERLLDHAHIMRILAYKFYVF